MTAPQTRKIDPEIKLAIGKRMHEGEVNAKQVASEYNIAESAAYDSLKRYRVMIGAPLGVQPRKNVPAPKASKPPVTAPVAKTVALLDNSAEIIARLTVERDNAVKARDAAYEEAHTLQKIIMVLGRNL